MATVNFINRKKSQTRAGMKFVLKYTQREDKTLFEGMKLVSGVNCSPQSVYEEFVNTKLLYGKDSQRMYYHFVQSFPPDENITPQTAHEIALKLAKYYKEFEVLVSTHVDCDHIHSHFIINSVSFETGKKLHQAASAIQELRQKSDALCLEYGLSVCQPKEQRTKPMTAGEYHTAIRGGSWKMRLINTIDECMRYASNKNMFIVMMESEGYAVTWTDTRKNITYTTPDGKRCRDDRLHEPKYLKEKMELELRIRQEIIAGRTQTAEQTNAAGKAAATADAQSLSPDTAGFGRTVRDFNNPAGADERLTATESQPKNADEQSAGTGGADSNLQESDTNTADLITGWEQERAFLFSTEASAAGFGMVTDMDSHSPNLAGIGSSVVQLGRAMERLESPVPITDATTKPQPPTGKKKKLAVGQKEDDHSGHDFEMKM
jgi:hypothetical protein